MGETYLMEYTCSNCAYTFERYLDKGLPTKSNGGTCDYCGAIDRGGFLSDRPSWLVAAEKKYHGDTEPNCDGDEITAMEMTTRVLMGGVDLAAACTEEVQN